MVVGDFTERVQTVILGAGPGGYVAAIRAAQLGQEVVVIEQEYLGGVCLNWGCIPSKAMIEVAGLKHHLHKVSEMGLITKGVEIDLNQLHQWKDGIVTKLRQGIDNLLQKNGIEVVSGTARFAAPGRISVAGRTGLQNFEFENAIIATGSSPIEIPGLPFDHELIIDSTDALGLEKIPQHLVVVGAGSVGLELGTVYRKLGAEVTVIEMQDKLLPFLDPELPRVLTKSLKKVGMTLNLNSRVDKVEKTEKGAQIIFTTGDKTQKIEADKILVATGRRPNTGEIGLENLKLETDEKGFLSVNEKMQTRLKNIYAIGDIVAGPMLAHRASHQGKVAAEVISGQPAAFDNLAIPGVIFSDPEIATVGLTEAEARERGHPVKTGNFPFRALGRAMTLGETEGLTKIISDAENGAVLGVHIIGPHASDLIGEGTLAVESAAHIDDLTLTIHAHPTLPEGIMEASEALENKAIHIFNPAQ